MAQNNTTEFYKCKSIEYSSFHKGKIYPKDIIGKYIQQYPLDWQKVLPFPTTEELIECINSGKNKIQIIKTLKQWKSCR